MQPSRPASVPNFTLHYCLPVIITRVLPSSSIYHRVVLSSVVVTLHLCPLGVQRERSQHAALSKFLPSEPAAAQSTCDSGATGPWYVVLLAFTSSLDIKSTRALSSPLITRARAPLVLAARLLARATTRAPAPPWTVAAAACSLPRPNTLPPTAARSVTLS